MTIWAKVVLEPFPSSEESGGLIKEVPIRIDKAWIVFKDEGNRGRIGILIYMYILSTSMARLISVTNEVYASLTQLKGDESFSKTILTLISGTSNKERLLSFFGKGGIDAKKIEELKPLWHRWSKKYA